MKFKDLSILIPTLNSRHLIEPIADQIREVFSEAGEIIVVDSYSEDGTLDLLKEILDLEHASFHSRPRGLYASWNFGIQRATKKWVHIATAGDILCREDLNHLYTIAEEKEVDVVSSAPYFFNESGEVVEDRKWPILSLLDRHQNLDLIELSGTELVSFALSYCRPGSYNGWLGSSASNLYKTKVLKECPFPTDVGPIGDSLWGLQNARSVSACFTRRRCGRFVLHNLAKAHLPDEQTSEIFSGVWKSQAKPVLSNFGREVNGVEEKHFVLSLVENEVMQGERCRKLRYRVRKLVEMTDCYSDYVHESRSRVPWLLKRFFLPSLKRGKFTLKATPRSD